MAVTFVEERKRQKKLLTAFGFLIVIIIVVLAQGFLKRLVTESIGIKPVVSSFRKVEIDFTILESQDVKDLESFEEIKPFEDKLGRENPFVPY